MRRRNRGRNLFYPEEPSGWRKALGFLGGAAQGVGTALAQKQWDDRLKRRDLSSDIASFGTLAREKFWTDETMRQEGAEFARAVGHDPEVFLSGVSGSTLQDRVQAARKIPGFEFLPPEAVSELVGITPSEDMMVARGTIESGPPQMGLTGPALAAAPTPPPDMTRPLQEKVPQLSPEELDALLAKSAGPGPVGQERALPTPWEESVTVRAPEPSPFEVEGPSMYSESLDPIVRQQEAQRESRERTGEVAREETAEAQRGVAITQNEMASLFSSEEIQRQMDAAIQMANNPEYDDAMREQFLRNSAVQLAAKVAELTRVNAPEGVIQQQIRKNEVLSAAMRAAFGLSHTPVRVTFPDQTSGFVFFGFDEDGNVTVTRAPGGAEPWSSTQGGIDLGALPDIPGLTQDDRDTMGHIISNNYYR